MEENTSRKNFIRVVGYLKENLLEQIQNASGENIIRGSIIVAVNELDSHKVQFYVRQNNKNGEETEEYKSLLELLPGNTISIASYLKKNPTANFAIASNMSTKVWVTGRFDEFTKREGERETTMILLKGNKGGIRNSNDNNVFTPSAIFTTENYLSSIEKEVDENGDETGRLLITGYIPSYNGDAQKITYVAPVEENVAAFISRTYKVGDTVTLTGDIVSTVEKQEASNSQESNKSFGRSYDVQYVTKFIRERVIYGGSEVPIHQGEKGCIPTEDMKTRLVKREERITSAGQGQSKGRNKEVNNNASESAAPKGFSNNASLPSADLDW